MSDNNTLDPETQEVLDEVLPDPELQITEPEEQPATRNVAQALKREQRADNAAQRKADREAGRQSILDAYSKKAQALGFKTVEEMFAAQQKAEGRGDGKKVQSEALVQANQQIETLNRQIRGYKSRITQLETELQLRNIAYESDVNPEDIEYAISRVHTTYKGLTEEQAKSFDPKKFLSDDLRAKKPSIFRQALEAKQAAEAVKPVEEQPVNTAPAGSAPKPSGSGTEETARRATQMTRAEYLEALRLRGIKNPAGFV